MPSPSFRDSFLGDGDLIARNHLDFHAHLAGVAMVALACSRGGSNKGNTPTNCHLPSSSARATPKERKPRPANSLTAFSTAGFTSASVGRHRQNHLRRPLGHLELFSVLGL